MNDIIEWLNSDRNFDAGVALYVKYGHHSSLKKILLKAGKTQRNESTLAYELGKLAKIKITTQPLQRGGEKRSLPNPSKGVVLNPTPEVVQNDASFSPPLEGRGEANKKYLIQTKNNLFKEYVAILHTIEFEPSEEERRKMALHVLDIWDEIAEFWRKINYIEAHGTLPPPPAVKEKAEAKQMDKAELLLYRNNKLRPRISQVKRLLATKTDHLKILKYEEMLQKFELELQDVERRLKDI